MRRFPIWLNVLWTLWLLSAILLAVLCWMAWKGERESLLRQRQLKLSEGLPRLAHSFRDVEQLGLILVTSTQEASSSGLEWGRVQELRRQAEPFFRFYFVDGNGQPVVAEDRSEVPQWLWRLAKQRVSLDSREPTLLRPLPPGYEAGRWKELSELDLPQQFLVYGTALPGPFYILYELDTEYLFKEWLNKQLEGLSFGDSLHWQVKEWEPGQPILDITQQPLDGSEWHYEVPTLLPDQVASFGQLNLRVRHDSVLKDLRSEYWGYLGLGCCVLAAFALSLYLTTRALRQREEYSQAKSRFVSMVGHELRTPITAIEMYLEILREGLVDDPDRIDEYHRILARESGRLKRLVENLLTAGVLESGSLKLELESVSLRELVEEVARSENRERRELELRFPETELRVRADRDALYGVLANLVQNAFKYSETKVVVEVTDDAEIQVADRGRGLPTAQDYERVFEPYVRAQGKGPGVGLGLALARELVEAMGGTISGRAGDQGGSVFVVKLPSDTLGLQS